MLDGLYPPKTTNLVGSVTPSQADLATVRSPKSVAFPVVAIVTKSMVLIPEAVSGVLPPPINPLVEFYPVANVCLAACISPKSVTSPVVDIVTKDILFFPPDGLDPPIIRPLVDDAKPSIPSTSA